MCLSKFTETQIVCILNEGPTSRIGHTTRHLTPNESSRNVNLYGLLKRLCVFVETYLVARPTSLTTGLA